MALSPLTVSLSSGVIGRPFLAAVTGQTAGSIVEVANGGTWGFGYSNGKVSHPGLPQETSLVILRERLPLTGESLLTNFVITGKGDYAIQQQALGINPTPKGYRAAGVTQGDGSLLWTLFVEDVAGSTTTAAIGAVTVTLGALTLSGTLRIGTATSGTIIGATAGSTITGNIPGITVNSAARTYSGTPTGASGTISNALVESLAGATNDNNPSSISVLAVLVTISGTPAAATIGSAYSFTPTTANGSGTKTFSYSGTALAGYGLSFNTATGAITGTVSGSAGTITGTISVTDSSGGPVNLAISIVVSVATVTLSALTLSGAVQNGVTTSGTIIGATAGSTIACNIPGLTVNSGARTYSGTPYTTGAIANALVETLAGATNTPNNSSITVAATALPQAGSEVFALYAEDLPAQGVSANGAAVTTGKWIDRVGGQSGTLAASSGTPVFQTNKENGLPSVKFTGTHCLNFGQGTAVMAALNSKRYTIMVIARALVANGTNGVFVTSNGGSGPYFMFDGTGIGQYGTLVVPFTPAQGAGAFTCGIRYLPVGANAWDKYYRVIMQGTAVRGDSTASPAAGANDLFIGGFGTVGGKFEIMEIHIWNVNFSHADDLQFHKYFCDKYAQPYPLASSPIGYLPVIAGDSISQGVAGTWDSWIYSTGPLVAGNLGLSYGQWINAATSGITAAGILAKDTTALAGLPAMAGIPCKIHEFEWVNSISSGYASVAASQGQICNLYRSQGFSKVILGTTLDYGNRTSAKANFVTALGALTAGTYDLLNNLHLDTNIGIDGAAPNTGGNTYFTDPIAHPNGHAGYPGTQSGYPVLAGLISAAFAAA